MDARSFAPLRWLSNLLAFAAPGTRRRRVALAAAIYVLTTAVYFACAPRSIVTQHTRFNHYALLADAWLHGRLDLGHPPPAYTQNNDFAEANGRYYISFPPFPAVLLLPWAKMAGEPENLRDGQVWLWFAGVGPALLFLALEKLKRMGDSDRSTRTNFLLTLLFSFGTVYFFTALQGTVWFAAHVVVVGLSALLLLMALDAEHPVIAGTAVGLLFLTRPNTLPLGLFFLLEALRKHRTDYRTLAKKLLWFALPVALSGVVYLLHNYLRFGHIFTFGHERLTIGWRGRIDKWGLFSYHFLARNLGIFLSSLPYRLKDAPYFQINAHGLALWVTTPIYLWLLWPKKTGWLFWSLLLTIGPVMLSDLLYQNSGWLQFGYRFSNDYAILLFALLTIGGYRLGRAFWGAALVGVAINTFGALTFERSGYERFYFTDGTQNTIYQPD